MNTKYKIEIGTKKNRLTFIDYAGYKIQPSGQRKTLIKCKCDCGKEVIILKSHFVSSNTVSCGCSKKENAKNLGSSNLKHGEAINVSLEYNSWTAMKNRCYNKNFKFYKYYGGRGIEVCQTWIESFEDFVKDMGRRPSKNFSLDRIDVNGNYEPSNCRWADKKNQANNRRNNKK